MKDKLFSVYVLLGPETGDKGTFIKQLRTRLRDTYNGDPEIHRFYPFETQKGEIFSALHNNSLFSEHRLVLLSQAEDIPQHLISDFQHYIKNPSPSATLLLISQDYSIKKLSSGLDREQVKIFYEMFEQRKPEWVRNLFQSLGMSIEVDAIELLLELVENNTSELRLVSTQLVKFLQLEGKTCVQESDIEHYIKHTKQESVFSLFECMATGTLEKSLEIYHTMRLAGEGECVPLLAGLLWQFRRLISLQELLSLDVSWEEACKGVTVMGKKSPLVRKKDHGIYQEAAKRYSLGETKKIIARIGEYDLSTRKIGTDMHSLLIEQLLMTIMVHKGSRSNPIQYLSFTTDAMI